MTKKYMSVSPGGPACPNQVGWHSWWHQATCHQTLRRILLGDEAVHRTLVLQWSTQGRLSSSSRTKQDRRYDVCPVCGVVMLFQGRLELAVDTLHHTIRCWVISSGSHMVGTQELSQLMK